MKIKVLFVSLLTAATISNQAIAATLPTSEANATAGFFYAYNDTDKEVTISVGNFFPTEYTIGAHSYRSVVVSTDNQNIHIKKVG